MTKIIPKQGLLLKNQFLGKQIFLYRSSVYENRKQYEIGKVKNQLKIFIYLQYKRNTNKEDLYVK